MITRFSNLALEIPQTLLLEVLRQSSGSRRRALATKRPGQCRWTLFNATLRRPHKEALMGKSPGHQKHPEHKVQETHLNQRVTVEVDGDVVAESNDVIRVNEDEHPARYYFPRSDVKANILERTRTTTECPFKATAHY